MTKIHGEQVIIPETKFTRAVTFRADKFGLYLLFWQDNYLAAGMVIQYPSKNPHFNVGYFGYSLTTEQVEEAKNWK